MGLAQRDEGRTALAASKLTAIIYRWASLDKGTLTGVYIGPTYCCHLEPLLAFSLCMGLCFLGLFILVHGQDAAKADCFGLPGRCIIQVVGGRVPLAPIGCKHSTPSPLPS